MWFVSTGRHEAISMSRHSLADHLVVHWMPVHTFTLNMPATLALHHTLSREVGQSCQQLHSLGSSNDLVMWIQIAKS